MTKPLKQITDANHDQALDHWLNGDVAAAYDAMKADPARGVSVDVAFAAVRAHHAKRMNQKT